MDTVCHGKHWDVALAYDGQGNITAALPYLLGSKLGMNYILQPQLTQYNGPWFRSGTDSAAATAQLTRQLRSLHLVLFLQNFAPTITDMDGWEHFSISQRPTYRLENISDPEKVFQSFDNRKRRRPIRKTAEQLHVDESLTPEEFARFHAEYWASRGQEDLLSFDFIVRIVNTALQKGHGILLAAKDTEDVIHGARFVAYDANCAYALLSALNPQGHLNGTSAFLFWNIILRLSKTTRSFDFEGSMDPGIAYSYRLYGATLTTYNQVFHSPIPFAKQILHIK